MAIMLGLLAIVTFYAFDKAYRVPRVFLIFMLAAGTLRFGGNVGDVLGGSTNLSSIWLLCLILLGLVAALRGGANPTRYSKPEIIYLFFLSWCVIEVLRSDNYLFGMRMFLKLFFPFLVMFLARNLIDSESMGRSLMRWVMISAFVSYLFVGGITQAVLPTITWSASKYLWAVAAYADYAALMCVMALVCWRYFRQQRYLYLAILLGSTSAFIGIRTGLLATAVGVAIFLAMEYRKRAAPLLVGVALATLAILVLVPEYRDKMFMDSSRLEARDLIVNPAAISIDQINSSGRFEMWAIVMERFFSPNPIMGSGLGSTQHWFYSGGYGAMRVEHSEFVRLLADTGVIGLGLYLLAMIVAMSVMWRFYNNAQNELIHYLAIFAFCSFPVYITCMAFDNVINYTLCSAQYPFALTGVTIGLYEAIEARKTSHSFTPIPTLTNIAPAT